MDKHEKFENSFGCFPRPVLLPMLFQLRPAPKSARSYTLFVTAVTDGMMAPALEARQEDSRFKPSASVDSCLHRFQTH